LEGKTRFFSGGNQQAKGLRARVERAGSNLKRQASSAPAQQAVTGVVTDAQSTYDTRSRSKVAGGIKVG